MSLNTPKCNALYTFSVLLNYFPTNNRVAEAVALEDFTDLEASSLVGGRAVFGGPVGHGVHSPQVNAHTVLT